MGQAEFVNAHSSSSSSSGPTQDLIDPFVFVPISATEAANGRGAAKSVVRAHVTRLQHAKSAASRAHTFLHWSGTAEGPTGKALKVSPASETSSEVVEWEQREDGELSEEGASKEGASKDPLSVVIPALPSGSGTEDPFWTYPVDHQPVFSPIFSHYMQNIAVDIPDLDGPNNRGLMRTSWFPLAMTEAAPMYAVLLMAASHYSTVNPAGGTGLNLLALKARALAEINAALSKPDSALTDAIIGAVAKMTAYEALFGDVSSYQAHRAGLQDMIKLRGGLGALGLNGLLEKMLVWIDLNSSHLKGLNVVFGGEQFPSTVYFPSTDLKHFAGISDTDAEGSTSCA